MKKIFQQQLLSQNVQMDGSINFQTNGNINVYPCPWECDKEVTGGERVHYRGGIDVLYRDGRRFPHPSECATRLSSALLSQIPSGTAPKSDSAV